MARTIYEYIWFLNVCLQNLQMRTSYLYLYLSITFLGIQNLYKWYCDCQWRLISMLPFVLASSGKTHFEGLDGLNEVKNVPTSPLNSWRGNPRKFVAFIFLKFQRGGKTSQKDHWISLGWKDIEKGADYSVRTGGCLEKWWQNHDRHGLAKNPGDENMGTAVLFPIVPDAMSQKSH